MDIIHWKVFIDIGLCGAVLYFAWQASRQQTSSGDHEYGRELEASLRGLVRESERASNELAQELAKRQKALEELLFDLETVEHRVNRSCDNADEQRRKLEKILVRVPETVEKEAPSSPEPVQKASIVEQEYVATPAPVVEQRTSAPVAPPVQSRNATSGEEVAVNIYGEPIRRPNRLEAQIEKEVIEKPEVQSMEDLYAVAEELLRNGADIDRIAHETKLSVEDIQMLADMIRPEQERKVSRTDQRLGVLGAPQGAEIRRERHVL